MNHSNTVEDFESAALPHLDELFRTARRVVGNESEAEDVVQETFLQAWKSFDNFETGTNCRAWLYKIMFYVIQHHRRKWFRPKWTRDENIELETSLVYEPPIPQDLTDQDVIAALDRIPAHFREVIILTDVHEFSYKEVAETLDVPVGTVMSRLSRGRKRLRSELSQCAQSMGFEVITQDSLRARA